jgi:hypothetical protein
VTAQESLPWDPLTPWEVVGLFAGWHGFWCIAGGWAIDVNLGHPTREHEDVDVLVLRCDLPALHRHLYGWELHASDPPGHQRPWPAGEHLPVRAHDLWCRRLGSKVWRFQIMVMDHDDAQWLFRRDRSMGGPLASLRIMVDGVPVIAPEIQLLYKGNTTNRAGRRPKDDADFRSILPSLAPEQRAWLREALIMREPDHPWIEMLES